MKFSIVVPAYNHAAYLEDCLKSLIRQREEGADIEIILMDGGSTDGTAEIIERYRPHLAVAVSEKDNGQTDALIKGFAHATGDVMGWLNSDDKLVPGALVTVSAFLSSRPDVEVVYGDMDWVSVDGTERLKRQKEIGFSLPLLLWDYNYIPQPSTFWRRSAWQKVSGLNPERNCAMDCDLWFQFIKAGCVFAHIPQVLSVMRRYPDQKNQRLRGISDAEDHAIREAYLDRAITPAERKVKKVLWKPVRVWKRFLAGAYSGC